MKMLDWRVEHRQMTQTISLELPASAGGDQKNCQGSMLGLEGRGSLARPTVLVAHAGKQHAYRHAAAVEQAGCLHKFVTSGYYKPDRWPDRLVSRVQKLDVALRRRSLNDLSSDRVIRRWRLELPELFARAIVGNGKLAAGLVERRDAKFDRWVARRFVQKANIYWGFQGSCLESLRAAQRAGRLAVAEFATAHVTKAIEILSAEARRHPEWADSISNFHFPKWYQGRLEAEPHAADICIAASEFTRQSLLEVGIAPERIKMLPLGADLSQFSQTERGASGKFRILFVGGVGQRKGIKYLLDAYRRVRCDTTELVIAGPLHCNAAVLAPYRSEVTLLGRMDQAAVVREMQQSHVLVLPSVFEGFGLVIPEAMATGMPVIASTHSAGPEIIRDGVDGYVLEPDDVEGLAGKLEYLASYRTDAAQMGRNAAARSREFSWKQHALRVAKLIDEIWHHHRGGVAVAKHSQ